MKKAFVIGMIIVVMNLVVVLAVFSLGCFLPMIQNAIQGQHPMNNYAEFSTIVSIHMMVPLNAFIALLFLAVKLCKKIAE